MADQDSPWSPPAATIESWAGEIRASDPWVAFPIGMLRFNANETITIDREFGTCFFIVGSIFMTAWHVVEDAVKIQTPLQVIVFQGVGEEPSGFSIEEVRRVERVFDQQGRPTDMAIGHIGVLAEGRQIARLQLTSQGAAPGTYVASYGYARTQWHEDETDTELTELSMNFLPRFHRGTIQEHLPNGRAPFWASEMLVHDAETGGGISGGPLFEMNTKRVCGVNSTGMDNAPYSVAADLRAALDWPIAFAERRTLRSLAAGGLIDLV